MGFFSGIPIIGGVLDLPERIIQGDNVIQAIGDAASKPVTDTLSVAEAVIPSVPVLDKIVPALQNVSETVIKETVGTVGNLATLPIKAVIQVAEGQNVGEVLLHTATEPILRPITSVINVANNAGNEAKAIATNKSSMKSRMKDVSFGARILAIDADTSLIDALGQTWKLADLVQGAGRITHVVHAHSMSELFENLADIAQNQKISDIQFLGHGSPGEICIGGKGFNIHQLEELPSFKRFVDCDPFLKNGTGILWFRTCFTLADEPGRIFGETLQDLFGRHVRIAGHNKRIPDDLLFHNGFVVLESDRRAGWNQNSSSVGTFDCSPERLEPIYVC
eukprot:TRINITY_DN2987_c0_g1_i1.p1 TRINITY_DN2987_c0_g1~~TRINITY_DN2987_c0_g1_i1.p1  ORF type:complete len:335 (+),score=68.54 TRINITY_DN2987_c0_g1_i1:82-1086(+)